MIDHELFEQIYKRAISYTFIDMLKEEQEKENGRIEEEKTQEYKQIENSVQIWFDRENKQVNIPSGKEQISTPLFCVKNDGLEKKVSFSYVVDEEHEFFSFTENEFSALGNKLEYRFLNGDHKIIFHEIMDNVRSRSILKFFTENDVFFDLHDKYLSCKSKRHDMEIVLPTFNIDIVKINGLMLFYNPERVIYQSLCTLFSRIRDKDEKECNIAAEPQRIEGSTQPMHSPEKQKIDEMMKIIRDIQEDIEDIAIRQNKTEKTQQEQARLVSTEIISTRDTANENKEKIIQVQQAQRVTRAVLRHMRERFQDIEKEMKSICDRIDILRKDIKSLHSEHEKQEQKIQKIGKASKKRHANMSRSLRETKGDVKAIARRKDVNLAKSMFRIVVICGTVATLLFKLYN